MKFFKYNPEPAIRNRMGFLIHLQKEEEEQKAVLWQ
jgi:hypothetical protein